MTQSSGNKGACSVCGKQLYVRHDGLIKQHMDPALSATTWYCTGSNKAPVNEKTETDHPSQ